MKKTGRKIIICTLLCLFIAVCAYAAYFYSEKPDNVSDANTAVQSEKNEDKKDEITANKPKPEEKNKEETETKPENREESKPASSNTASSDSQPSAHSASSSAYSSSEHKGHYETRYETIPAYDEEVLVKEGYYEKVLVQDAWDEEDTYCYAYGQDQIEVEVCNTCGEQFQGGINQHLSDTGHSGWHNDYILSGEPRCQEYRTEYIHHDAQYEKVWHEPEYRTVHHPEETRSYQVWVDD